MLTEEDEVPITPKKKSDKGQSSNDSASSPDKSDSKKNDKVDVEDPKPRIVLTFRSDKKNSNMKIVPNDEKHEEFSPRRSSRTRNNKWEWSEEAEMSISPKKDKNSSQSVSENDEASDSSHATSKRSTRGRSKDSSDNVLANAIARKEKSYNEAAVAPTQRLSRRIKPTAKILANEELRIGLESQNNARLGLQSEKSDEGVRTRKSARSMQSEIDMTQVTPAMYLMDRNKKEPSTSKDVEAEQDEPDVEEESTDNKQSHNRVMKLKHLCELGLKAINPESMEDETVELDDEEEEGEDEDYEHEDEDLDDDEIDDDSEVISKLLEADEDSDEDFSCAVAASSAKRPRRSTRLCSSYVEQDNYSPVTVDDEKETSRRSSRRSTRSVYENDDREYRPSRKRTRLHRNEEEQVEDQEDSNRDVHPRRVKGKPESRKRSQEPKAEEDSQSVVELGDDISEPAAGDEGSEAACPDDDAGVAATCFCETPSNVYAGGELAEPVFCQAIELVDGVRVGCSHGAARGGGGGLRPLLRAGPRAPFLLACALHTAQLRTHMCCPACGLFCTQGIFYQCSEGHLFHLECGLPYNDVKARPGCPHCGVGAGKWQPRNKRCRKVRLQMRCSNKRIFLPDQREQCTPAYLSFTTLEKPQVDQTPLIPEDLLPSPPIDLKALCETDDKTDVEDIGTSPAQRLCDAILAGESVQELLPKIAAARATINEQIPSLSGGTCALAAARRGALAALHALHCAGAHLHAADNALRTPLLRAVIALLEKAETKSPSKTKKIKEKEETGKEDTESKDEPETEAKEETQEKDSTCESVDESKIDDVKDEDLIKVVRYLVAAGCDVNLQGPEGLTALHLAAQGGDVALCQLLLDAANVEVDSRDHGGWTPLVWAAENGHVDVVRLLLSRGADASTRDSEGNGCVHWCALAGHSHVLKLLLDYAPHDGSAPNNHKDTPLHIAARQDHYACVVILLARGARTDLENSAGELPVEVCSGSCQSVISLNMQMALVAKGTIKRHKILSSDLSNGSEMYPLPCVNEVDDEPAPADFTYVADHVMPEPLDVDCTIQSLQGCACKEGECGGGGGGGDGAEGGACACCALSVRRWSARGRLRRDFPHHEPPMLFECNATCACNKRKCGNMLITRLQQRGSLFVRAEVFRTNNTGWGLRATAAIPQGTPVALYCGELLPLKTADSRANDQYLFALDVKPDLAQQCGDKPTLCVDACAWGSAARFVNHSCAPNLAPVRVFTRARDLALPCVALFASRPVRAGEQLTFDYGDKFWSVKSKWMKCECGSPECRYPVKSTETEA